MREKNRINVGAADICCANKIQLINENLSNIGNVELLTTTTKLWQVFNGKIMSNFVDTPTSK